MLISNISKTHFGFGVLKQFGTICRVQHFFSLKNHSTLLYRPSLLAHRASFHVSLLVLAHIACYISWRPFLVMFLLYTLFGSSSSCHDISYSPSVLSRPSLPILSRNKTRPARPVTCMELLTLSLLGLPSLLILSPVMPLTDTDVSCHGCLCSSCLLPWLLLLALPPVMIPYARLDSLYSSCLLSWLPL